MCTLTRKEGSEVERRCHVAWTFQSTTPDTRWEANFVFDHSKALQHKRGKQQQDCASGYILTVLPEGLIQDSTCLKRKAASGVLYSCHAQQKLTQSEHKYSPWQQWCCASLRRLSRQPVILCVLSFATSSSGNSVARKTGMPSTVCLLKYSRLLLTAQGHSASCPPTPSTAVSTATIQHICEDYKGGLT